MPLNGRKLYGLPVELTLFFLAAVAIALLQLTLLSSENSASQEPPLLPPTSLPHFAFGARESTADMLWIRSLQGFPPCIKSKEAGCPDKKWLGAMFLAISDLAPHFRMLYAIGGMTLSVLLDDQLSASQLYDRGIAEFPEDSRILSRAAYHAMAEEKNPEKAADLLKRAARFGAPAWYLLLAARLRLEQGDREFGEHLLSELEAEPEKNFELIQSLRQKLAHKATAAPTH